MAPRTAPHPARRPFGSTCLAEMERIGPAGKAAYALDAKETAWAFTSLIIRSPRRSRSTPPTKNASSRRSLRTPAVRRLGADTIPSSALAEELQRRCILLKRMRARSDSKIIPRNRHQKASDAILTSILWMSYLMMLENDGKNERQLREFAKADEWLKEVWFDGSEWKDVGFVPLE